MNSEMFLNIFMLSLGFVPLVIGLWHLKKCISLFSWNETEGIILESKIVPGTGAKGSSARPKILYEFEVNGQKHISDQVSEDNFTSGILFAIESVINRYPFGRKVKVFYNPDHPEQSVLERRITLGTYLWLAVGIFFLVTFSLGIKSGWQ
jgi:uncharacterized protein DUF3592